MQKQIWLLSVLSIIIVILIGILIFVPAKPSTKVQPVVTEGIQVILPTANEEVSSPINITGIVNGGGWGGFEGQVGTVKLLDGNGNELATSVLTATTDWTISPTNFKATITLGKAYQGSATLIFSNENPSGMPQNNKIFTLPVIIK